MRIWIAATVITCLIAAGIAQTPAGQLAGSVVDANDETMPGVTVLIAGPTQRTTTTSEKGTFTFRELPVGDYQLTTALKGFATVVRRVRVTESTEPIRVRMRVGTSAGQIGGSARDVTGVLLAGVFVQVSSPALVEKYRATNTGSNGRYRFTELPDGTYSITFTFPGFSSQRRDNVELKNSSTATVDAKMEVGGESEPVIVRRLPIVHRSVEQASHR